MGKKGNGVLTEPVLVRVSKAEKEAWLQAAAETKRPVNLLIREIMARVLGLGDVVQQAEQAVVEATLNRAAHMRQFRHPAGKPSGKRATRPGVERARKPKSSAAA